MTRKRQKSCYLFSPHFRWMCLMYTDGNVSVENWMLLFRFYAQEKLFEIFPLLFFLFFITCKYIMYMLHEPPDILSLFTHEPYLFSSIGLYKHSRRIDHSLCVFCVLCAIPSPFRLVIPPTQREIQPTQLIIMWLNTFQPLQYLISNVNFPRNSVFPFIFGQTINRLFNYIY